LVCLRGRPDAREPRIEGGPLHLSGGTRRRVNAFSLAQEDCYPEGRNPGSWRPFTDSVLKALPRPAIYGSSSKHNLHVIRLKSPTASTRCGDAAALSVRACILVGSWKSAPRTPRGARDFRSTKATGGLTSPWTELRTTPGEHDLAHTPVEPNPMPPLEA